MDGQALADKASGAPPRIDTAPVALARGSAEIMMGVAAALKSDAARKQRLAEAREELCAVEAKDAEARLEMAALMTKFAEIAAEKAAALEKIRMAERNEGERLSGGLVELYSKAYDVAVLASRALPENAQE